jgi:hypothetical protein
MNMRVIGRCGLFGLAFVAIASLVGCGGGAGAAGPARTGGESETTPGAGGASASRTCIGQVGREFTGCLADKLTTGKYDDVVSACRDNATTSQGNNAIACVTLLPAAFYLSRRTSEATNLLSRACRDLAPEKKTMLAATCVYTTAIALRPQQMAAEDRKQTIAGAAQSFAAACDSDPSDVIMQAAEMDKRAKGGD